MTCEQTPARRSVISNLSLREEIRQELRELRSWMKTGEISRDEYDIELHDKVFELEILRFEDRPIGDNRRNPRDPFISVSKPQPMPNTKELKV